MSVDKISHEKHHDASLEVSRKKALIMGVTNDHSIATGIAKAMIKESIDTIYTYVNDSVKNLMLKTVRKLDESAVNRIYKCDVASDEDIIALMTALKKDYGHIDYIVHSIAFANKECLATPTYYEVSRADFQQALDISCYSLTAVVREAMAHKLLNEGSSIVTMSYYGAQRWIPFYNVMGVAKAALEASVMYLAADLGEHGIRLNAISPGPIKTLSGAAIKGFRYIGEWTCNNSPLHKLATIDEVGAFTLSVMNSPIITGYTLPADCGYQIVGIKHHNAPDITSKYDGKN